MGTPKPKKDQLKNLETKGRELWKRYEYFIDRTDFDINSVGLTTEEKATIQTVKEALEKTGDLLHKNTASEVEISQVIKQLQQSLQTGENSLQTVIDKIQLSFESKLKQQKDRLNQEKAQLARLLVAIDKLKELDYANQAEIYKKAGIKNVDKIVLGKDKLRKLKHMDASFSRIDVLEQHADEVHKLVQEIGGDPKNIEDFIANFEAEKQRQEAIKKLKDSTRRSVKKTEPLVSKKESAKRMNTQVSSVGPKISALMGMNPVQSEKVHALNNQKDLKHTGEDRETAAVVQTSLTSLLVEKLNITKRNVDGKVKVAAVPINTSIAKQPNGKENTIHQGVTHASQKSALQHHAIALTHLAVRHPPLERSKIRGMFFNQEVARSLLLHPKNSLTTNASPQDFAKFFDHLAQKITKDYRENRTFEGAFDSVDCTWSTSTRDNFRIYDKDGANTKPLVEVTYVSNPTVPTQKTIEIIAASASPDDKQLWMMMVATKEALDKQIPPKKNFRIEDCENNPEAALKLYLMGKSLELSPVFTDKPAQPGATLKRIIEYDKALYYKKPGDTSESTISFKDLYDMVEGRNGKKPSTQELLMYISGLQKEVAPQEAARPPKPVK